MQLDAWEQSEQQRGKIPQSLKDEIVCQQREKHGAMMGQPYWFSSQ